MSFYWMNVAEQAQYDAMTDPEERDRMKRLLLDAHYAKKAEAARQDPRWKLPNWVDPHARLLELLPAARATILAPGEMDPDGIIAAADASGTPFALRTVYNPRRRHKEGIGEKWWEDYEDDEIFELLFKEFPMTPGALWFVPHDCFYPKSPDSRKSYRGEPYLVDAADLHELVCEWPGQWAWPGQLDADTIFIWRDTPRITIVHHEGWLYNLVVSGNGIPPVEARTTQGIPRNPAD